MRLESHTIGNMNGPTVDDICRSFENRNEWDMADIAGNVYSLLGDDGTSIHSISGHAFKDFSLSVGNGPGLYAFLFL